MGVITFNGVTSKELGIEVESFPTYEFPEREYDVLSVPGKNGDVYIDKGSYKNVPGKYELAIGSHEITQPYLAEKLVSWLTSSKGYCRLEDSYYPEIYRMALYKKSGSISNIMNHGGRLTVEFECKPQKFLKTGELTTTFTQSGTITNPTNQPAKPLLKISGRGNGVININGHVVNLDLLESAISEGSTISKVNVDSATFMEAIGSSTDNNFTFTCTDLDVSSSIDATGITGATVDASTFLSKTEIDREVKCEFVFVKASANITNGVSNTISAAAILDEETFLNTFSAEGNYIFTYASDYTDFTKTSSTITNISVNASTYKARYAETYGAEEAYIDKVYTYDASMSSWKDGNNYSIELSDYGIEVTGTPSDGDTITGNLKVKWKNQGTDYSNLFIFSGYPSSGDELTVTVVVDHWIYKKDSVVIIDTNLVLAEYGISVTGTAIDGDAVKVSVKSKWKLDDTAISLSDYGITYSGIAIVNDEIYITLGQPITIDCDVQDAYSNTLNRNKDIYVQTTFPELDPGTNGVNFSGGITSVEVTPRWWTL